MRKKKVQDRDLIFAYFVCKERRDGITAEDIEEPQTIGYILRMQSADYGAFVRHAVRQTFQPQAFDRVMYGRTADGQKRCQLDFPQTLSRSQIQHQNLFPDCAVGVLAVILGRTTFRTAPLPGLVFNFSFGFRHAATPLYAITSKTDKMLIHIILMKV